ncbi:unnamed protein product [Thelazia callipaeda]|uniref:Neur_chan_LBD domain-containing protein n=1 Tax=Thelazia callipaeda TaxID=103827 RepID=A0A0N5D464_THECL|nr:unnamed protein product [Thelazia callipaeda]
MLLVVMNLYVSGNNFRFQAYFMQNIVHLEMIFGVTYTDERLIIPRLKDRFCMPVEYRPWLPELTTRPTFSFRSVIYLDPISGIIDVLYKYAQDLDCSPETWRHPFDLFRCEIVISNVGDERIFLRNVQDLRNTETMFQVSVNIETSDEIKVIVSYLELWFSSMVTNILPSMIIFCVVIFAQWRRRKIHMFITVLALTCIILLQQSANRKESILTLEDLWLSVTFLHVVCVLLVDLMVPSHRIQYVDINSGQYTRFILADVDVVKRFPPQKQPATFGKNSHVVQQRIITTSLGHRKRISLATITCCYFIFAFAYFTFVIHLILKHKNFFW